jgi:hypothetical protein
VLRGTGPCPTEEKSLSALGSDGENFMEVSTSKKAGAEKAVVSVSAYDYPTNARYYRAMASGRVPAKSLQIANDLDPAELELPDDVAFLSGGIRSRDPEPSEEDKFANCGSDKSYGYVRRNGSIGGVLRIKLTGDRQYEMNKDMVMSGLSVKSKVVREAP